MRLGIRPRGNVLRSLPVYVLTHNSIAFHSFGSLELRQPRGMRTIQQFRPSFASSWNAAMRNLTCKQARNP